MKKKDLVAGGIIIGCIFAALVLLVVLIAIGASSSSSLTGASVKDKIGYVLIRDVLYEPGPVLEHLAELEDNKKINAGIQFNFSTPGAHPGIVPPMSHFFAYLSRMKFIRRWGLMHNTYPENVQEHSLRVAQVAHALAIIRNRLFEGTVDPDRVAVLALYHDAGEVLTGDLPAPIKYFNPEIKNAYHDIETSATERLLEMVPGDLAEDYRTILIPDATEQAHLALVKAADKLCAYMKCLEETAAGNREFSRAEDALRATVEALKLPEVV